MKRTKGVQTAAEILGDMQKNQVIPPGVDATGAPGASADAAKPPVKKKPRPQRIETIMVRHDFTEPEKVVLGSQLADEARVAESIQSEAKACARQYKDKLETAKVKVAGLVDKIKEGFEMVPVEAVVMVQVDRKEKTARKCFYRKDTGAFIKDENALNVELELFNVLPDKADIKKSLSAKLLNSQV